MTTIDASITTRAEGGLARWLIAAAAAFALLVAALGALAVYGVQRASNDLRLAEQSLSQLENARAVEAAFNGYLLAELQRRLAPETTTAETEEAGLLRGTLRTFRAAVGAELASARTDAEREDERGEMRRVNLLTGAFEEIERAAMLSRHAAAAGDAPADPASFAALVIAPRLAPIRAVVGEALADERDEAARAFARLDALRGGLTTAAATLVAAFAAMGLWFGALFMRKLARPIRALTEAAERLPQDPTQRASEDLPAEFAPLARRFNAMAERLGGEQARLQAEVAARTAELTEANAALRRVDADRRAFFAEVSHELRTPVTVMLGEAQIAQRGRADPAEALRRIVETGRFLSRRLDDLLRLARSEDGTLETETAPVALAALLEEVAETARGYAAANEVTLAFSAEATPAIQGDAETLRQAALALIDNAVKLSPPQAEVTVAVSADGFSVADRGPGFGSVDPASLFSRYAQGGKARAGVGLGLAIVKRIADRHGAVIEARDREGGGACVTLRFP